MSTLVKSTVLSLGLLAGVAVAAHAQSSNVAALPPGAVAPQAAPVGPSPLPGPNPGAGWYGGTVSQQQPVVPSANAMPGPNPGLGYYGTPQKFEKPAGYDQNAEMKPYTTPGMGPRPN